MAEKLFSKLLVLLALFALTAALPIYAQNQASNPPSPMPGVAAPSSSPDPLRSIELSTGAQSLSNGYGDWRDVTLRGSYGSGTSVWQGEFSAKRQFGQDGNFLGLSDTVTLNADWFAMLSLGAGDGAFYLPQFRSDAFLYRKWLPERNLVTSIGAGYYHAPDGHTDRSLSLGGTYYFKQPWILEAGVRFNTSDPGAIRSNQQFVAATYGTVGRDILTVRHGWGGEAYQAIASNITLVNFDSYQTSVAWRHWLSQKTGVLLSAEQYTNPSYQRQGITVGLFHQF
jgi:YaiO family outer membrane protein